MSKELRIIILAAGKGTRMNSELPKVLHKLNGKVLLDFVLDESELLNPKETILVVGFKKEQVISHTQHRANLKYVTQMEQLGTGHAVLQTADLLKNKEGHILILYGDLIRRESINLPKVPEFPAFNIIFFLKIKPFRPLPDIKQIFFELRFIFRF